MNEPESLQHALPSAEEPPLCCDAAVPGGRAAPFFTGNLFLIGFMGAGKSTVASAFHTLCGMKVLEMDEEIERRAGMPVSDIFSTLGEEAFRQMETELITTLEPGRRFVVSCGGGTPMREVNVRAMRRRGTIVWLTATADTVLERVADSNARPLLEGHKDRGYIQAMMNQRRPKYQAAADIAVATDGKDAAEICGDILAALAERSGTHSQEG
ncbi:MAG: shikimate kinase [Clostridiales bacterium]|nr:shikimate kinase [Clostridiales bacterium]